MKNLIIALALFVSLLVFGSFVITRSIEAQKADVLTVLLEMPAPPPPNPLLPNHFSERGEEFYNKKNPPADNAPIEELLDYWKMQSQGFKELGYNIQPSGRSLDRILGEIDKDPNKLTDYLNILPENSETADLVKRIYDQQDSKENQEEDYRGSQLKNWLKNHTDYFADELLAEAQAVSDTDAGYVTNQESLLALSRVDWNKAQTIINRMYNDASHPVSQTLARWALYRHALDTDSLGDIERYRDELKADVENKKASDGMRDLALDALVKEKDWSGRDDWYYGLLEDETLADLRVGGSSYTGLTTIVLYSSPDKYADKMIGLLKSNNPAVRNAAIRNLGTLLDEKNVEVIKALLPWLEDKNWATEMRSERQALVTALANFEVPESVPGLIALLDEKSSPEESDESEDVPSLSANTMSNRMTNSVNRMSNTAIVRRNMETYLFRSSAISALAKQKDVRAVPALRRILLQADQYERATVIRAILLSHGFSTTEQIEALETAAIGVKEEIEAEIATGKSNVGNKMVPIDIEDGEDETDAVDTVVGMSNGSGYISNSVAEKSQPLTAAVIKEILGQQIITNPEPAAELLTSLIQRINILDRSNPPIANALRRIILNWNGAGVNLILLNDLKNNKADINEVIKLLTIRKELKEKQPNDVYAIRSGGSPFALGISACILDTQSDYNALLVSENADAKAAMFGCARLIRAELPVRIVAQNLNSPNKPLALAAERYLEAEDSAEARQILLAKYPNEAKILGATKYFGDGLDVASAEMTAALFRTVENIPWFDESYLFYGDDEKIAATERKLQEEVKAAPELLGVYAYDDNFVRIYGDRVMFSYAEDDSRYRERYLTETEFNNLKNYLAANRVDELTSFLTYCEGCTEKELLMLGRQGGRRVYFKGDLPPAFFAGLDAMFGEMRKPPTKLRYELEKFVPGLEILYADENLQAGTVWKKGTDLRLLVADKKLREQIDAELTKQESQVKYDENTDYEQVAKTNGERRLVRAFDHISWRRLANRNSLELTSSPTDFFLPPVRDGFSVLPSLEQWKAKTANLEIRADMSGLYKISGGSIKKIREGFYNSPLVTSDGRWAVVTKFDRNEGMKLMRVNLLNNQEFEIKNGSAVRFDPAAISPSGKKLLVRAISEGDYYSEMRESPETFDIMPRNGKILSLDLDTGAIESVKGEIRPLAQQTFRPLQKAASADEFWAAIPDAKATQVGIYNIKTLSFKPLISIPQIAFSSMSMWVDETENKVYFVYKGQLLALSFPKK